MEGWGRTLGFRVKIGGPLGSGAGWEAGGGILGSGPEGPLLWNLAPRSGENCGLWRPGMVISYSQIDVMECIFVKNSRLRRAICVPTVALSTQRCDTAPKAPRNFWDVLTVSLSIFFIFFTFGLLNDANFVRRRRTYRETSIFGV